jgi:hypothetical protein
MQDAPQAFFKPAKQAAFARGLAVADKHIFYIRKLLEMAQKTGMMPPPNFGDQFEKPRAEQVARVKLDKKRKHGARAWSVEQLRQIIAAGWDHSPQMFACVMLGLNVGFGNDDCAFLENDLVDRQLHLIRGAFRNKNLRERVCPLWTITEWALGRAWATRIEATKPEYANRIFLNERGTSLCYRRVKLDDKSFIKRTSRYDWFKKEFSALLDAQNLKIHGANFYTLRAMFRTLAVGSGVDNDLIAVIKGQKFERPIDEYYLRGDLRSMLFKVSEHVFDRLLSGWSCPIPANSSSN